MCALHKELSLDFSELAILEIRCPCSTRILLDLNSENVLIPVECPGCRERFAESFGRLVLGFKQTYRALAVRSADAPAVGFRIPFRVNSSSDN